jgi:hypothetical protein
MKHFGKIVVILVGFILIACVAGALVYYLGFAKPAEDSATRLSAIVLVGFALTVVFMAALAIIYAKLGIDSSAQALGLPEGSVRALLAFSLVLIFVCLAAFLFSEVNKPCDKCAKTLARVNDAQLSDLKTSFIVAAEQARDEKGKPVYEQVQSETGGPIVDDLKHPLYSVTYYPKQSTDGTDFAKQIFTTLATVFVSVVSFYFGSSVTSSAVGTGAKAAQLGSGTPPATPTPQAPPATPTPATPTPATPTPATPPPATPPPATPTPATPTPATPTPSSTTAAPTPPGTPAKPTPSATTDTAGDATDNTGDGGF